MKHNCKALSFSRNSKTAAEVCRAIKPAAQRDFADRHAQRFFLAEQALGIGGYHNDGPRSIDYKLWNFKASTSINCKPQPNAAEVRTRR